MFVYPLLSDIFTNGEKKALKSVEVVGERSWDQGRLCQPAGPIRQRNRTLFFYPFTTTKVICAPKDLYFCASAIIIS
ncbi:hypothetical protein Ddc_08673 [Ditylenchus destructor]|nr:hypothetical protein Ddc_08673 [Ditylenchus destructor]